MIALDGRSDTTTAADVKACCASFYADDVVRMILGDSFHPGGLELTRQILNEVGVGPTDRLLDVAAGPGSSSVWAAAEYGCSVTALDLSVENLERARLAAQTKGVAERFATRRSDAERLPFAAGELDVVLCECAFCTFPDKATAAREMARVLRPGGRLALSDMAVGPDELPAELDTLLMRVACIADAVSEDELTGTFAAAGFRDLRVTDAAWGLREMVDQIRQRLLAVELASKLGRLDLGELDLEQGKTLARAALEAINEGQIRYVTLTAVRSDAGAE